MKYFFNSKPSGSVVPTIELLPNTEGKISRYAMYEDSAVIHLCKIQAGKLSHNYSTGCFILDYKGKTKFINLPKEDLFYLAKKHDLPLEEVEEIANIERQQNESLESKIS